MTEIKLEFSVRDFVTIVTDKDKNKRQITGILIRDTGITYAVSFNGAEVWAYQFELRHFDEEKKEIGFVKTLVTRNTTTVNNGTKPD